MLGDLEPLGVHGLGVGLDLPIFFCYNPYIFFLGEGIRKKKNFREKVKDTYKLQRYFVLVFVNLICKEQLVDHHRTAAFYM